MHIEKLVYYVPLTHCTRVLRYLTLRRSGSDTDRQPVSDCHCRTLLSLNQRYSLYCTILNMQGLPPNTDHLSLNPMPPESRILLIKFVPARTSLNSRLSPDPASALSPISLVFWPFRSVFQESFPINHTTQHLSGTTVIDIHDDGMTANATEYFIFNAFAIPFYSGSVTYIYGYSNDILKKFHE